MDTKSKKFNRTPGFKAVCLVLCVALMFGSALSAVIAVGKGYCIGTMDGLTKGCSSYYDSLLFVSRFGQAVTDARLLLVSAQSEKDDAVWQTQKESAVTEAFSAFREKKAEIIRDELTYVVDNYENDYYDSENYYDDELGCEVNVYYSNNGSKTVYDYGSYTEVEYSTVRAVRPTAPSSPAADTTLPPSSGESTTALPESAGEKESVTAPKPAASTTAATRPTAVQRYPVDALAPANIQAAQNALNAQGTEILQYEYLVRREAFDQFFFYNTTLNDEDIFFETEYTKDEATVQADFEKTFDNWIKSQRAERKQRAQWAKNRLSAYKNLKYYIVDINGTVTTNLPDKTAPKDNGTYPVWFSAVGSTVTQRHLDAAMAGKSENFFGSPTPVDHSFGPKGLTDGNKSAVYMYFNFCDEDAFSRELNFFTSKFFAGPTPAAALAVAAALFVLAVAALCLALPAVGHKNGADEITLRPADKIPTDIHGLLSLFFIGVFDAAAIAAGLIFLSIGDYSDGLLPYFEPFFFNGFSAVVTALCLTLAWVIFVGWLCSVVRIKKAKRSWLGGFVLIRFAIWFIRKFVSLCRKIIALFAYKPKKFRRNVLLLALLYFFINFLFLILACVFSASSSGLGIFFTVLCLAAFNGWVVWNVLRYIKELDTVIDASGKSGMVNTAEPGYPTSLKTLADNMNLTQENLQQAIDAALRDERMKTELITNVSHDLKTPLTGIINYVDLLRRCDIQDETAKGYLDILDEKSNRLKSLIEDLVEASKVSSGAITLNLVELNLNELASQVIGEMDEDFAANHLEIDFNCPEEPTTVTADSQKTYRIIDNLLTNARKYSLPYSRVYITVSRGADCAFFEVKNISRDKLNITSEELMERFVRGDRARTDGGNGLGLSIARDLAALQNGQLVLTIDGDMFKATLCLPIKQ